MYSGVCTRDRAFELWKEQELRERSELGSQVTYSASEGELVSEFVSGRERDELFAADEQMGQVMILEREEKKYTCTAGELGGTGYQLVIYENVSEGLRVWNDQIAVFVWMEIAASLMMAVILYFIMRKFLEPVSSLSEMTAKIAAGDYTSLLEVRGKDELSGLAKDINHMTEQVRENMESKEEEAQHKQEFIDALSHELRTPLTSVRGYAELVRNTNISKEKQIHWEIEAGEGKIRGNRILTELFFLNLMRNSFHACKENGDISVWIDSRKAAVTDNGVGMTKECQEHIFEPFYREDKSRSRKLGGSGLGMYLCHSIADRHGWEIRIDSRKGVGTRVEVMF